MWEGLQNQIARFLEAKALRKKVHFLKNVAKYIGYKEKKPRKWLINLAKISIWKCCFIFGTYIQLHFIWELFTDPVPETTLALKNAKPRRHRGDLSFRARWPHLTVPGSVPGKDQPRASASRRQRRSKGRPPRSRKAQIKICQFTLECTYYSFSCNVILEVPWVRKYDNALSAKSNCGGSFYFH